MPEHTGAWPTGAPAWFDLAVSDVERAKNFYAHVFGWQFTGGQPEFGGYLTATRNGSPVAGIAPQWGEPPGEGTSWTTYLAADDAAGAVAVAVRTGARLIQPAVEVGEVGTIATLTDPGGARFGIYQAGRLHQGAGLVNEPGGVVWNEAMVNHTEAARACYTETFGVGFTALQGLDAYWTMDLDGRPAGGLGDLSTLGGGAGAERPHWRLYFHSDDVDATLQAATEVGGQPLGDVHDSPFGRMSGIRGPEDELFWVINPPDWS